MKNTEQIDNKLQKIPFVDILKLVTIFNAKVIKKILLAKIAKGISTRINLYIQRWTKVPKPKSIFF